MFADNLVELRKYHALSQEELAEKIGVSRQTLSKYETGESLPDIEKCKALADVFGDNGIIGLSQMTCGYAAGHIDLVLFSSGEEKGGAEQFNTSIFHKPDCLIAQ